MDRFCDDLRQEREQRRVSLEEISAQTKVSIRHLEALETGRLPELPGGVFRKGILRGYLSALEMEPEPWLQRFETLVDEASDRTPAQAAAISGFAENVRRGRPEEAPGHKGRWLGILFMLLGLAALLSCVWVFTLRGHVALQSPLGVQ